MPIIVFSVFPAPSFRRKLLCWYGRNARKLPWRATSDPYRIWVSEIMLQQTRVAAVIPYYERFLKRFPDVQKLAQASEEAVLAVWSGLGYYSRARNLHQAAKQIAAGGSFPSEYESIRRLPGAGNYTAAAIASIAFGLSRAVLDGNVRRVLSRLTCANTGLDDLAEDLLDRGSPGKYNQALMELGATLCLPRSPKCAECPVAEFCEAKRQSRQVEFPAQARRPAAVRIHKTLLLVERQGMILLRKREFWELPEAEELPAAVAGHQVARFRHSITNHNYRFTVLTARLRHAPPGWEWVEKRKLGALALSTVTRKALAHRANNRS